MNKVQVLISTMNQIDHSLLDKMNIQTDAIVVNQCDRNEIEEFAYNGNKVKWISLSERGVGLSRNTALMRSEADIILFADDDVVYDDNYENKVLLEFEKYPDADFITFNLTSLNPNRPEYIVQKDYKLRWYNCLKFGTFRFAVRRESVFNKNICYSLLFGGGAKYQSGEDSMFITQCITSGLKGYASAKSIGTVEQRQSTWFCGINEKYYYDKGALFGAIYKKLAYLVVVLFELKGISRKKEFTVFKRLKLEFKGIKDYLK